MIILDGKIARAHYTDVLIKRIKDLTFVPCLVIIQVGNRPDSDSYIKSKKSFAQKIGVKEIHIQFPENVEQKEIIETIKKYNDDQSVQGIIVQLPLPPHLNADTIVEYIDSKKDVDGLTSQTSFIPATARGISELLDFYNVDLSNKKVTVVGRSKLVGLPISKMCEKRKAIVTVCHSKTENIKQKTKDADIVIVAIGKPHLIDESYLSKGQIIVDVGITRVGEVLQGDVNFEKVKDIVEMITPVPGGVGQMTVLSLFENLVDACYNG
jgi:methylenetetrahydrofolate dehydrogenase (NADP+)/methenyltetrahydrofolate cyclohydrolase